MHAAWRHGLSCRTSCFSCMSDPGHLLFPEQCFSSELSLFLTGLRGWRVSQLRRASPVSADESSHVRGSVLSCLRSLHDNRGQFHLVRVHSHWLAGSCWTVSSSATDVHGKRLQCDGRSILLGAADVGKRQRLAAISPALRGSAISPPH